MRVPSRIPPGEHRIRITWEGVGRKLERVFTFIMKNPDFGKRVPDPLADALAEQFADKKVAVLQQGMPDQSLGIETYDGCADTFIATRHYGKDHPGNNYGAKDHLWVGVYGGNHRTLVRYELSALPQGAKIEKAVLRIFAYNHANPAGITAHRMLRPWGEGDGAAADSYQQGKATEGMDWQHLARPPKEGECSWLMARSPEKWAKPGCDGAGEDFDAAILANGSADQDGAEGQSGGHPVRYWTQWDVTAAARAWAEDPSKNFGVLLKPQVEGKGDSRFYSSDFADPPYRPRLVLVYAVDAPALQQETK